MKKAVKKKTPATKVALSNPVESMPCPPATGNDLGGPRSNDLGGPLTYEDVQGYYE